MPLKDILSRIASTSGLKLNVAAQRAYLIDEIVNNAAKELYDTQDMRNCEREQIFDVGVNQQIIALPWYVEQILGIREYDNRIPNQIVDKFPRYKKGDWTGYGYYKFREIQLNAALCRETLVEGPFRIRFRQPVSRAVTITVTGSTPDSTRISETLTYNIGDQEKTTTNTWLCNGVESIRKSAPTDTDLSVYDIEDNVVAEIANSETQSLYMLIQILERAQTYEPSRLVEVLFRLRFTPFKNDNDSFPGGDDYDQAIYWKCLEHIYAKRGDEASAGLAIQAYNKCNDLINKIDAHHDDGKTRTLDFEPNVVINAMDYPNLRDISIWRV
jgi:hypothetical protein